MAEDAQATTIDRMGMGEKERVREDHNKQNETFEPNVKKEVHV